MAVSNNQNLMVFAALIVWSHMSGCAPISDNPLSDPASAKPDRRLIGTWYSKDPVEKQQSTFLHIGPAGGIDPNQRDSNFETNEVTEKVGQEYPEQFKKFMRATQVYFYDGQLVSRSAVFFPTQLGSGWYVSLPYYQQNNGKKISIGYSFWRYNLEGDTLTVWDPEDCKAVIIEAIRRGKLKGEVHTREIIGEIPELTDSTENIRKYLRAEGDTKIAKMQGTEFRRITP
jgi:hypothetical protein